MSPLQRLLPLICTLFFVLAQAQQHIFAPPEGPADATVLNSHRHVSASLWFDQPAPESLPGFELVQKARAILDGINTARPRRYEKPSGILGTSLYWAKQLFRFLFMNAPPDNVRTNIQENRPLAQAAELLQEAAAQQNPDAIYLLADMSFYGNFSYPRNYEAAFKRYQQLASLTGNTTAQHMVGFMYATGIGNAIEPDHARALLYHTFAALAGDTRAEMTVAYRHHSGIGTPRNCDEAAYYYKRVADKTIQHLRSGPPGGRRMIKQAYRLADEEGGVYGEGASVSSSGKNAPQGGPSSDTNANMDDVLEYLDLMSRKGDLRATFSLARLYYDGSRTMNRNMKKAKGYFLFIARKYWYDNGKLRAVDIPNLEALASKAAGYLGRMFLRGEGMEQNFEKAIIWFQRGIANGDPNCQNGLGMMYLNGYGVPKDAVRAADLFRTAADQDLPPAQVNLAALLLDQGDTQTATRYLELAVRHANLEAYYYLAEIANAGLGRERSCGMATAYYKIVAERADLIHAPFRPANDAFAAGDTETALVNYMMAAEQGYEAAQANVAFLLDEQRSWLALFLPRLLPAALSPAPRAPSMLHNPSLALTYWTRSAKQSNLDSMIKMGDYYLLGLGTTPPPPSSGSPSSSLSSPAIQGPPSPSKAATCYHVAAEFLQSSQALWNLGWLHENGIGVDQDFHLAKRFYDHALEASPEAYLPVRLALWKLRLRSWWNSVSGGGVNSIEDGDEEAVGRDEEGWSLREWLAHFLADEHPYYDQHDDDVGARDGGAGEGADDDLTSPIAMGGAGGEDDDLYGEIFFLDDGMIESVVIVGLAAALAALIWYRQQRGRERQEGARDQDQGGEEDNGLFPRPGDPERAGWVVGGVGH